MARIRSIHPGQWRDVDFVECSFPARLLAIGLRNEADDQGVFEWKPKQLTMNLFPADAINIEPLLSELTINNIVTIFEIGGRKYGAIRNFRKYQRPKSPNCLHPLPEQFRKYVGLDAIPISEIDDDETEPSPKSHEQMEEGGGNRRRNTSSLRSDVSAEPQAAAAPALPIEAAVISIPSVNDGIEFSLSQSKIDEYAKTYPAVDVMQELREMRSWCIANPKRRPTIRGMPRFVNSWLGREQDKSAQRRGFNGRQNGQSSTDRHLAGLALLSEELHRRESG